eukprot:346287_1
MSHWVCFRCTLRNSNTATKCIACYQQRKHNIPDELAVYAKMLKFGVPKTAVIGKMIQAGYDRQTYKKYFEPDSMSIDSNDDDNKVEQKSQNNLSSLVHMMQLSSQLSADQHNQLLSSFIDQYSANTLMRILYQGLQAQSKHQKTNDYISFLTNNMNNITSHENAENDGNIMQQTSEQGFNLVTLHLDSLIYVCQFLDYHQLTYLKCCNRYLYQIISDNPYCCVSLDSNEFFLSLSTGITFANSKQFSFVTNLYGYKSMVYLGLPRLHEILPNITQFTIPANGVATINNPDYNIGQNLNSLQILSFPQTTTATVDDIFSGLTPHFHHLVELNISLCSGSSWGMSSVDTVVHWILFLPKLQKLCIEPAEHRFRKLDRVLLDNDKSSLWQNLSEFKFKGAFIPSYSKWTKFIRWVIVKCKNLKVLELSGENKVFDEIFQDNSTRTFMSFSFGDIKELVLDMMSPKIGGIYQVMSESNMILSKLHLCLWDKQTLLRFPIDGTNILNDLKVLLESQMFKYNTLTDLQLSFAVYDIDSIVINLLFIMLINLFENHKTNRLNSLKMSLCMTLDNFGYIKELHDNTDVITSRCFSYLLSNLLNALYDKINYCFLNIYNLYDRRNVTVLQSFADTINVNMNNRWVMSLRLELGNVLNIMTTNCIEINKMVVIESPCVSSDVECKDYSLEELRFMNEYSYDLDEKYHYFDNISDALYPLDGFSLVKLKHKNCAINDNDFDIDFKRNDFEIKQMLNIDRKQESTNCFESNILNVLLFHFPTAVNVKISEMEEILNSLETDDYLYPIVMEIKSMVKSKKVGDVQKLSKLANFLSKQKNVAGFGVSSDIASYGSDHDTDDDDW